MLLAVFLGLLGAGQASSYCGSRKACTRELLQQSISDHHGGFEDATRHEQYDFQQSANYQKIQSNTSSYVLPERNQDSSPACTPELLHTGLLEAGGALYGTADGHYYFEPAECRLRRLSGQQARSCLSGRHIDFVGDSVIRRVRRLLVNTG